MHTNNKIITIIFLTIIIILVMAMSASALITFSDAEPNNKKATYNPRLSIQVEDSNNNPLTIIFETNSTGTWQEIGTQTGGDGVYYQRTSGLETENQKYYWRVNVFDGVTWTTSPEYNFTALPFILKWTAKVDTDKIETSALAVDVNHDGIYEVFASGNNTVQAFDGLTGQTLWTYHNHLILYHAPIDINDLDNDGTFEILVGASWRTVTLNAEDGSVFWDVPVSSQDKHHLILDTEGNHYPYVYVADSDVAHGLDGYARLKKMNGTTGVVLAETFVWRPCSGGLAAADGNNDGKFEIYLCERAEMYGGTKTPSKGMSAWDADTLELLWYQPDITCSSHTQEIIDINGDGVLDGVALYQSGEDGGVCIVDGATGQKMPGKCQNGLGLNNDQNFPIYDIDNDGNLEILTSRYSNAQVWDVNDWKLDATLEYTIDPPKVADVIGDEKLEIVLGLGYHTIKGVVIYDGNYQEIERISGVNTSSYILVQDIDNDEQNELILISYEGEINVYETSAYAPTPRVRTNNLYYSEKRLGAAVYEPLPGPPQPIMKEINIDDGAINTELNPTLSARVVDFHYDLMDIEISTNASGSWETVASWHDVGNDWYSYTPTMMDGWDTTYYWKVSAVDPHNDNMLTEKTYKFTTQPQIWEVPEWSYRKAITIDHAKVNGTLNNFPVLIEFTDASVGAHAQTDADDILFMSSEGTTKLAHEIESYDSATGHLVAWVNVPALSSTEDTVFYMYYGNSAADDQSNPTEVWDSNYLAVHHLEETEGTIISDSTGKNDGTQNNVTLDVEGKIDGADQFNGADSRITLPQVFTNQTKFTAEGWFYLEGDKQAYILSQSDRGLSQGTFVQYQGSTGILQMKVDTAGISWPTSHFWHHVVGTYDGTRARLYVDGKMMSSSSANLTWPDLATIIGDGSLFDRTFQGTLDEIRLSDIARSAAYIQTSFDNQNDPVNFISLGAEDAASSRPAIINEFPAYRETNVLFNITELSFDLWDNFNDPMNYTVTTSPNIGSASGNGVANGRINVLVGGLQPSTEYTWIVDVTDGIESAHKEFTFKTIHSYDLAFNTIGSGAIIPNHPAPFAADSVVQLTAVPNPGWSFLGWNGDLLGSENPISINLTNNKSVTAIFGPTGAPLLADTNFDASTSDEDLRANATTQDWYESRAGFSGADPTLLTLNTDNIGGDSGKKAKLAESPYIDGKYVGNAYLTQEFIVPQPGRVSVSWDVYVDTILDYRNVDRAAHTMIGVDTDGQRGANSAESERFLTLAFYHADGSTVPGANMSLLAQEFNQTTSNSSQWKVIADNLKMDKWYNIRLDIDVQNQVYDIYVDNVLKAEDVKAFTPTFQYISHISFATWNDGIGTFYIDNVQAESLKVCIDHDNDGYGVDCSLGDDCDDSNAAINPGALEICDSMDNDCDLSVDEDDVCLATEYYCDADTDSYISNSISGLCFGKNCIPLGCTATAGNDCNDASSAINPGMVDSNCNGVDENCNGINDEDYVSELTACGIGVCVASGATSCVGGAVVDSCTPLNPPMESDWNCNNADDDCDGYVDEDYFVMPTSCGLGVCAAAGEMRCIGGVETDTCIVGLPTGLDDDCNGVDDNCDGIVDGECLCYDGETRLIANQNGLCAGNTEICLGGGWIENETNYAPVADDNCDNVDDDCDGTADEDYIGNITYCGTENCPGTGQLICVDGIIQDSCVAPPDGSCSSCGDAVCDEDEDCSTCPLDCGICAPTTPTTTTRRGGGGGGGGGGIVPSDYWTCSEWSDCVNGKQTQECTHNSIKKTNTQSCTVKESTPTGSATTNTGENNAPAITGIEGASSENEGGETPVLTGSSEESSTEENQITGLAVGENTGITKTPWGFIGLIAALVIACAGFVIYKAVKSKKKKH